MGQNLDYYSSDIIELCYVSKANNGLTNNNFLRLINSARRWNEAHDVTSVLFFRDGFFCQTIEGSLKNLDLVCRRIRNSQSHNQICHLETRRVQIRSIPGDALKFYAHDAVKSKFPKLSEELAKSAYDRIALIKAIRLAAIQSSI